MQVYKRRIFLYNGVFHREVVKGRFSRKSSDFMSNMALVSVQISSGAVHVVHLPWNIVGEYNGSCKYMPRLFLRKKTTNLRPASVFEEIKNKIKNLPPASVFFKKCLRI